MADAVPPPPRFLLQALLTATMGRLDGAATTVRVICLALQFAAVDCVASEDLEAGDPLRELLRSETFLGAFNDDEFASIDDNMTLADIAHLADVFRVPQYVNYAMGAAVAAWLVSGGVVKWAAEDQAAAQRVLIACGCSPQLAQQQEGCNLGALLCDMLFPVLDPEGHAPPHPRLPDWIVHFADSFSRAGAAPRVDGVAAHRRSATPQRTPPPTVVRRAAPVARLEGPKEVGEEEDVPIPVSMTRTKSKRGPTAPAPHSSSVTVSKRTPPQPQERLEPVPRRRPRIEAKAESAVQPLEVIDVIDVDDADEQIGFVETRGGETLATCDAIQVMMRSAPHRLPHEVIVALRRPIPSCDVFELTHHYTVPELKAHITLELPSLVEHEPTILKKTKSVIVQALVARYSKAGDAADGVHVL